MKNILFFIIMVIGLSSIPTKQDCQCEGSITYYYNGKPVKEIVFKKGYYITGDDCAFVKGEQIRYDSVVFMPQVKK